MYKKYLKRIFDFSVSLVSIIVLSPVILLIALLIKINLGSPVLYNPQRPGKSGKIFTMYKFRTMIEATDEQGFNLPDSERITPLGGKLRSTSLDELPELINVLKGDMSLVGPRPLAKKYLPYYSQQQNERHSVLPGITGLAQINGRNTINWEERFDHDLKYIESITFMGDLKILAMTVLRVLKRSDIGSRHEQDTDIGIEDFDKYCQRKQSERSLTNNLS